MRNRKLIAAVDSKLNGSDEFQVVIRVRGLSPSFEPRESDLALEAVQCLSLTEHEYGSARTLAIDLLNQTFPR